MFVGRAVRDAELAFLNAPFSRDGWLAALQGMAAITGSTSKVQLIGIGGPRIEPFNILSEMPHDPHGHMNNRALHGAGNWRVHSTTGVGTLQHEAHYATYRALHPTADYDDACSDLDLLFGCQVPLLLDSSGLVGLALMRSRRDGPCDAQTLGTFQRLARQAHKAVRVQLALGQEAGELMLEGKSCQSEATLLLDWFGQIVAMTETAERLFDDPCGFRLCGLVPKLANPHEQRELEGAFSRLYSSDGVIGPMLHEARVGRSAKHPNGRWRLHAVRLPDLDHGLSFQAKLAVTLSPLQAVT